MNKLKVKSTERNMLSFKPYYCSQERRPLFMETMAFCSSFSLASPVKLHTHIDAHTHTHTHPQTHGLIALALLLCYICLGLVKSEIETSGPPLWLFRCRLCFSESSLTDSSESVCKSDSWGKRQNPSKGLLHSFSHKRWDLLIRLTLLTYFRNEPQLHPGTASPWRFEQALLTVSSNRLSGFNIWLSFPQVHDQVFSLRYELTGTLCSGCVCGGSFTDWTCRKCRTDNLETSRIQGI